MKLINPTDAELNAAFVEKVAQFDDKTRDFLDDSNDLNFTASFDAVLPWLEKWRTVEIDWDRVIMMWRVGVGQHKDTPQYDPSLSRAAVITLLRAHNVEVEFTP